MSLQISGNPIGRNQPFNPIKDNGLLNDLKTETNTNTNTNTKPVITLVSDSSITSFGSEDAEFQDAYNRQLLVGGNEAVATPVIPESEVPESEIENEATILNANPVSEVGNEENDTTVEIYARYEVDFTSAPKITVKDSDGNIISAEGDSPEALAIQDLQRQYGEMYKNTGHKAVEGVLIRGKNGGLIAMEISQGTEGFNLENVHAETRWGIFAIGISDMIRDNFNIDPNQGKPQLFASAEYAFTDKISLQADIYVSPHLVFMDSSLGVLDLNEQKFGMLGSDVQFDPAGEAVGGRLKLHINSNNIKSTSTFAIEGYEHTDQVRAKMNTSEPEIVKGTRVAVGEEITIGNISLGSMGTLEVVADANGFLETVSATSYDKGGVAVGGNIGAGIVWNLPVGDKGSSFRFGLNATAGGELYNSSRSYTFNLNPSISWDIKDTGVSLFLNGDVVFVGGYMGTTPYVAVEPQDIGGGIIVDMATEKTGSMEFDQVNGNISLGVRVNETALKKFGNWVKKGWDATLGRFFKWVGRGFKSPTSQID